MSIGRGKIVRILLVTAGLLMVPLVAMQFTDDVVWTPLDFEVAGFLLAGSGLLYELATSRAGNTAYRIAAGVAVGTALFLVWANLAVGLIGDERNPANLMYVGVLAVGLGGAVRARLEPKAMARALFATALAQALVALIALTVWQPVKAIDLTEVLGVNAFFVTLWISSALLFLRASARPDAALA
jgi:hypothetical protein